MAVTNVVNGTQVATITTEHVLLAATATSGVYVYIVDCGDVASSGLQNGDVVELRIYNVVNGGTEHLAYYAVYAHLQAQPVKFSVPVPNLSTDTIRCTLKQTAGTGRTFRFRVVTVG